LPQTFFQAHHANAFVSGFDKSVKHAGLPFKLATSQRIVLVPAFP